MSFLDKMEELTKLVEIYNSWEVPSKAKWLRKHIPECAEMDDREIRNLINRARRYVVWNHCIPCEWQQINEDTADLYRTVIEQLREYGSAPKSKYDLIRIEMTQYENTSNARLHEIAEGAVFLVAAYRGSIFERTAEKGGEG